MKSNFLSKARWYIVGIIIVAIMLSLSLSFCAWDTLSAKASMNVNGGSYRGAAIVMADDKDNSGDISMGDIVTYGNFYQAADAVDTHQTDPLRWIVVDYNSATTVATLLAEKVIIYGNYWGLTNTEKNYEVLYYNSNMRSWLNSGKGSLLGDANGWKDNERIDDNTRSDGVGSTFGINQKNQVNKGFLDVAFTDYEKSFLIPKKIYDMKLIYSDRTIINSFYGNNYVNDLVWIPSISEIYGSNLTKWGATYDGSPNIQFKYFSGAHFSTANELLISGATDYAWNAGITSYTNNGQGGNFGGETATMWITRSPDSLPIDSNDPMVIDHLGIASARVLTHVDSGVRPAVNVRLG